MSSVTEAYDSYRQAAASLAGRRWRTGHQNPCNIYADMGTPDYHDDHPIGQFVTPELAEEACMRHNNGLAAER
jgi:hypothetical protein